MKIINPEALLQAFEDIECGKVGQISSKDFETEQSETKPLEGYEQPVGFPNCCEYHKQILQIGIERFDLFPNCCESHKKLNTAQWFNKNNYSYLPYKLVTTISYTWHCIIKCIENPNWYKEITDYIEYTKKSYGQLPEGFGPPVGTELYLYNLEKNIEAESNIVNDKKEKLLAFLKQYSDPHEPIEQTDINLLISKYKQWLKIFPFELSFFAHLKPHFENQMPILSGKGETNIYTGLTAFKIKTKKELIGFLISTTQFIIKEINTKSLFQDNLLNEIKDIHIEVLLAKRKVELEELDKTDWDDRKGYIKLLKAWLKGEKEFLTDLTPLIKQMQDSPIFINDMIEGIRNLQKNDTNEPCIINVREDKPDKETSFRYWFKNFFSARYPEAVVSAEEEKGNGRIDLKISQRLFGDKIIEFKGWWNQSKAVTVEQVCSYLTDFENDGYIFMINHLETKDIIPEYKSFITQQSTGYIENSWTEYKANNSDFSYYESHHKLTVKEKSIYHFIFNVYFSIPSPKRKNGNKE